MALLNAVLVQLLLLALLVTDSSAAAGVKPAPYSMPFNLTAFPADFIFGAGSAAYQIEGAAKLYGRGPSIWDTFTKNHPEKISDKSTGDVAVDFYHRYKSDIQIMKKIGVQSFRFSISWSRVLPYGKISKGVNPMGVQFYNNLINELLANGIKPFVTLFHWDVPQALEDEYGGLLSPKFVDDYKHYADFCFQKFGDRVKYWVTLNEPGSITMNAYTGGTFAPGRCSKYVGTCDAGNSGTEPYIAARHLILSHANAVKVYREKYQAVQKGQIGITLATHWVEPATNTEDNRKAAYRVIDFLFGWFLHPITHGDYPESLRTFVGVRLPKWTPAEVSLVKGSMDFLGLNYYTTQYATHVLTVNPVNHSYYSDWHATISTTKNGVYMGKPTALNWLVIYPKGLLQILLYVKATYKDPIIYITENGVADARNDSIPLNQALKDIDRVEYLRDHLLHVAKAIKEGVRVKGYYPWSFLDDFEWDAGYTVRFGMIYIDFKDNLKRHLKYSAYWFKRFLLVK
ncbi:unnamed protein product [Rhodiola kirilowii]